MKNFLDCGVVDGVALTQRQERFVQEYLVDLNATAAAIRAGYREKTAAQQGYNLLKKPKIQLEIRRAKAEREERTRVTSDMVVQELAKIAFASGADYAKVVGSGDGVSTVVMTPTDTLNGNQRAAIACIEETKFGIRVSTCDKVRALELLGKHLGAFEGNGGSEDGGVILVDDIEAV